MTEQPLEMIYDFVKQSYFRQQVEEVLLDCLEQQESGPIHGLVEELILAGPDSLSILQEIIATTGRQRALTQDKLHQMLVDLQKEWSGHGIEIADFPDIFLFSWIPPEICVEILMQEGVSEEKALTAYSMLSRKNRQEMNDLVDQLRLLQDIETYLQDWLWGMAYESYHFQHPYSYTPIIKVIN